MHTAHQILLLPPLLLLLLVALLPAEGRLTASSKNEQQQQQRELQAPPANDLCVNAIPINVGVAVSGSTVGSTPEGITEGCGTRPRYQTTGGVWYTFQGTGGHVRVSTCTRDHKLAPNSYDTRLDVYSGPCGDALVCIDSNDNNCGNNASRVQLKTTAGTTYRVLVHGHAYNTGTFGLIVQPFTPPTPPANDQCAQAQALELDLAVKGNTVHATNDQTAACGAARAQRAPGVWFSVVGTGRRMFATTCTRKSQLITTVDTMLKVYSGECGALACVDGNNDNGGQATCEFGHAGHSGVAWNSVAGETYHILATGYFANWAGIFGVLVTEEA